MRGFCSLVMMTGSLGCHSPSPPGIQRPEARATGGDAPSRFDAGGFEVSSPAAELSGSPDTGDAPDMSALMSRPAARPVPPPTVVTSSGRIIALGDVHGDISAARKALGIAGVVDTDGHWVGGHTVVVRVGDQLDRGDDEREILDWFEVLADEAFADGGAFYALVGNHEQMNTQLDFRYVTPGGWVDFEDIEALPADPLLVGLAPYQLGRGAAFRPGGPYATILAGHNVMMIVDTTLFVQGGVFLQQIGEGLESLNAEHQAWMRGEGPLGAAWTDGESPVRYRSYSDETGPAQCEALEKVLTTLGLGRIVVAHTVRAAGINTACDGRAVRVDVGMAAHYGGVAQVLEFLGGQLGVLK